ncbi:MAG: hypothetical protein MI674_07845 [Cytophagales bacterium]|nr:hypothetical protein [Cytophagales bacterium]
MRVKISITGLLIFVFNFTAFAYAREYKTAVGIRGSIGGEAIRGGGITVRHFFWQSATVEGIVSATNFSGTRLIGLYEYHFAIPEVEGLQWYAGGGMHITALSSTTLWGIDAIGGIEYTFGTIPLNIGLSWKPELNITGKTHTGFASDIAAHLRFSF